MERPNSHYTAKYSNLSSQHTFYPIAVETLGPLNEDARLLLSDLSLADAEIYIGSLR